MKWPRTLWFVAQSVSAGLALAFLIVLFQPTLLAGLRARLPAFLESAIPTLSDGTPPRSYAPAVVTEGGTPPITSSADRRNPARAIMLTVSRRDG